MIRKELEIDSCPKPPELVAYLQTRLYGKRNEEIFLHLRHCSVCLHRLADLKRVPSPGDIIQHGHRSTWWQRVRTWWSLRRPR